MNKIVRYGLCAGSLLFMFVVATILHKTDVTSGGILNETTQIMYMETGKGILCYLLALILAIVSAVTSRKIINKPLTGLLSWVTTVIRTVASLALVSGGVNIFVFERKTLQFMQLLFVLLMICLKFIIPSETFKKNNA